MNMTEKEKDELISILEKAIEILEKSKQNSTGERNCYSCEHGLNNDGKYCELHDDKIPEEWRNKGCDQWIDAIPF